MAERDPKPMPPITVVIADKRKASRAACLRLLRREKGIRVVGEARSGLEVVAAAKLNARIVLLNVDLSPGNSVALLRILRQRSPRTRVILLTDQAPEPVILDALYHGARGYIEKKTSPALLLKAVQMVDAGQAWVPRIMVGKIIDHLVRLTARRNRRR